jgi:hypothetical protein
MAVICPTGYRAIGDEAGISVYCMSDSSLANSLITFSIENIHKVADVNAENVCESAVVSFADLTAEKAYKVSCTIINENGDSSTITTIMHATQKPEEFDPSKYRSNKKIEVNSSRMMGAGF